MQILLYCIKILVLYAFLVEVPAQIKPLDALPFNKTFIEPFLDSLIPGIMRMQNIQGCTIVIVNDSAVIFSKGYGYADLENKKPFDPSNTIFRTASVCKVVTATALMQLKEKGLIDFKEDINKYLKRFKIKDKYGKPVTTSDLLTHTPGFDDFNIGKSARSEKEAVPLGEFLEKHLPDRVTPPGEVYSYSNMGMALAAFLIEEITGKDFEAFVSENLFIPLQMYKSSFRVKNEYKDFIYKGYVYLNGRQVEFPFDFLNDYPAGQMLTTANEFSNFMIMQLHNGLFNGKQIVAGNSIEEMQSVQFTHHPRLTSAMGYGFGIEEYFGKKLLNHDGGYPGIQTRMMLFPELKFGLFMAVNGYNSAINRIVSGLLINKLFPDSPQELLVKYPLTQLPDYDMNVDRFIGVYRSTRYSRNEISKLGLLMGMVGNELPIWKNNIGMLMMYDYTGKERRLIQVEPLLFQSIDDDYYIKFREDPDGEITHLFTDGVSAFEKTPLLMSLKMQKIIIMSISAVFLLISLTGLVRGINRKIKKTDNKKSELFRLAENIASVYLLYFLLLGLVNFFFVSPLEQMVGFPYGMPWYFYILQLLPFLFIFLVIFFIYKLFRPGTYKLMKKSAIPAYFLFVLVCITGIWMMNYWNLIGYKF